MESRFIAGLESRSIDTPEKVLNFLFTIRDECKNLPEQLEIWDKHYLKFRAVETGPGAMAWARGVFTSIDGVSPEERTALRKQAKHYLKEEEGTSLSTPVLNSSWENKIEQIVWSVIRKAGLSRGNNRYRKGKGKGANSPQNESDQKCYSCGKKGHFAWQCTSPPKK